MSYILDAIQKLEQKRRQEVLPGILTLESAAPPRQVKRTRWPYAIAGIVLLNGFTIASILWINPWRHAESQPKKPPASLPAEEGHREPASAQVKDEPRLPLHDNVSKPVALPPENILHTKPMPVARQKSTTQAAPDKKPKTPWSKNNVMAMQNLPENLKTTLPDLKMTVHSYDNHSPLRFAIINERNLKEGEFLNPDLKLVEITPAGVILDYQGFKFILRIN